jgi:AcrR family transcriptional regulator
LSRAEIKAATRERLLSVAREEFRRRGFDAVSMRDLARAAKCSTGGFFAYWPTKIALWEDAMGAPAPDFAAFCERVAICCAGYPGALGDLADDAIALRRLIAGAG